jgi:hypothetical protein
MTHDLARQIRDSIDDLILNAATKAGFWTDGENYHLDPHAEIDLTHKLYDFSDELISDLLMMIAIDYFKSSNAENH